MPDRTLGVLLAGGRSSRMGREKPLLEIGGRLLIERVAAAVVLCASKTVVVTNRPELYSFLNLPTIQDTWPGRGPLAGIHAGLRHATCERILVVACDYPFLDAATLRRITAEDPAGGVIVPFIDGKLQPLCALYSVSVLPLVETSIASGELMVSSLLARLPQRVVQQRALGGAAASRTFFNVNTPEDLRRAEEMLAEEAEPRG